MQQRLCVGVLVLISATWVLRRYSRSWRRRSEAGSERNAPAQQALACEPQLTESVDDAQACRTPTPTSRKERQSLTPTRETGVVVVPPLPRLTPRKEQRRG